MESKEAVAALAALAQASRLAIFRALVRAGDAGLQPTSLAESLDLPANTLSFHLRGLLAAGLATQQRRGRALIYRADYPRMNALMGFLTRDCCGGASCAVTARRRPAVRLRRARRA